MLCHQKQGIQIGLVWIFNDNTNHNATDIVGIPLVNKNYVIDNFMVYEEAGHGIVNFGISQIYPVYNKWTSNNFNGIFHLLAVDIILLLVFKYVLKVDMELLIYDFLLAIMNALSLNITNEISQIEGMEQSGYGIVNLRIYSGYWY